MDRWITLTSSSCFCVSRIWPVRQLKQNTRISTVVYQNLYQWNFRMIFCRSIQTTYDFQKVDFLIIKSVCKLLWWYMIFNCCRTFVRNNHLPHIRFNRLCGKIHLISAFPVSFIAVLSYKIINVYVFVQEISYKFH